MRALHDRRRVFIPVTILLKWSRDDRLPRCYYYLFANDDGLFSSLVGVSQCRFIPPILLLNVG